MKEIAEKAGLENPKLRNQSARKTMVQTRSDQGASPTLGLIAQFSAHKNLKSIENCSSLTTIQQQSMSNTLADIANEKAVSLPNAAASNPGKSSTFGIKTGVPVGSAPQNILSADLS